MPNTVNTSVLNPGGSPGAGPLRAGQRRPQDSRLKGPAECLRDEMGRRLDAPRPPSVEQRAFLLFQLAHPRLAAQDLARLDDAAWPLLLREIESFTDWNGGGIFHLAFERRFYTQTLDAIALHARNPDRRRSAALPGAVLHRRARGVAAPPP